MAAFWALFAVCAACGAGTLQALGPQPAAQEAETGKPGIELASHPAKASVEPVGAPSPASWGTSAQGTSATGPTPEDVRPPGNPVASPQAALLEPAPDFPGASLPRTARSPDGKILSPMKAYGGGFDPTDKRPRVAVLLAGLGLSRTNSDDAIKRTPPGVTLAFSPYAVAPDVDQARSRGHEIVLSIPMEPAGYPLEDEGPQALLTGASTEANQRRLEWSLSRFQGYAGTTGALGELRGERFARSEDQMAHTLSDLSMRGLYYIDPRVSTMPGRDMVRGVDLSFDDGGQSPSIDASLDALTKLATRRGTALGLVGSPRPVNVEHIAAWAGRLDAAGVVLVPVSALLALNTAQLPSIRAAQ